MATFMEKLSGAISGWNAFASQDPNKRVEAYGTSVSHGPYSSGAAPFSSVANERNIVSAIYTQLAVDVSSVDIRHVKLDENDRYEDTVKSGLNYCLTLEANIDQASTVFRRNIAEMLFNEGVAAVVPVDTTADPDHTGTYTINSMRVGKIVEWFPRHVLVDLYNDRTGNHEQIYLSKTTVAIVPNPFYNVMNEPNGTVKRLVRKLSLLDSVDEAAASGKLDLIIKLPYTVKTETRKAQAETRRQDVEMQLKGSQYGIAYVDGTEDVIQLNRPAENNLMKHIEVLTTRLYAELGLTEDVFNGTADEKTMLNYYNRSIEPILTAIVEELKRTFLTKTAVAQGHSIKFFRDPFKLMPISSVAELGEKFVRNEILSANEVRSIVGFKPSSQKGADDLRNPNLKTQDTALGSPNEAKEPVEGTFEKIPPKQLNQ